MHLPTFWPASTRVLRSRARRTRSVAASLAPVQCCTGGQSQEVGGAGNFRGCGCCGAVQSSTMRYEAVRCRAAGCDTKRCGAEQQDAIRSGVAQYDTVGSGGSYDARRVAHVCTGVNVCVHDCACTWCGGSSLLRLAVSRSASMSTETPPTMALGRAGRQGSRRHGITASLGGAGQQADDKVGERREVAGGEGIGTSAKLLQRVDENGW